MILSCLLLTGCGSKTATTAEYTVDFDSNGGSSVASQTVEKGDTLVEPNDPTQEGYTFAGWYVSVDSTIEYDFTQEVTKSFTLYAKWVEDKATTATDTTTTTTTSDTSTTTDTVSTTYTVTFKSNGGSSIKSQTVTSGSVATQPTNPTRSGYTFLGWYNGSTKYNFSTKVTKNITLTAKWSKDSSSSTTNSSSSEATNSVSTEVTTGVDTSSSSSTENASANTSDSNSTSTSTVEPSTTETKQDTYTYKTEALDMAGISYKVYIYKNGTSYSANAVYTASGSYLGSYESDYDAIIVDSSSVSQIGAIKVNGSLMQLTK
jgi:uncharacterized repeat protein (TIGR02543 family)